MVTEAECVAMQVEFDAFVAEAPARANRMRDCAGRFVKDPEIMDLMLRIADSEAGWAEFAGAHLLVRAER